MLCAHTWLCVLGVQEMVALLPAPALSPIMPWGPVIDGVVLTEFPQDSLVSGNFNQVRACLAAACCPRGWRLTVVW